VEPAAAEGEGSAAFGALGGGSETECSSHGPGSAEYLRASRSSLRRSCLLSTGGSPEEASPSSKAARRASAVPWTSEGCSGRTTRVSRGTAFPPPPPPSEEEGDREGTRGERGEEEPPPPPRSGRETTGLKAGWSSSRAPDDAAAAAAAALCGGAALVLPAEEGGR